MQNHWPEPTTLSYKLLKRQILDYQISKQDLIVLLYSAIRNGETESVGGYTNEIKERCSGIATEFTEEENGIEMPETSEKKENK